MDLSIHNHLSCGGDNVYIELNQGQIVCQTQHKWNFDRGTTLSWTGYQVRKCFGKDFSVDKESIINFKIRSTSGDDFCPHSLSILWTMGISMQELI